MAPMFGTLSQFLLELMRDIKGGSFALRSRTERC
jgi:hypothetical protein